MQFFFNEILDSTQNEARTLLTKGESLPFLVQANEQLQGRGRLGRKWNSQSQKNAYFTLVFELDSLEHILKIPAFFGSVLAGFIEQKHGFNVRLKWPNDVFFNGRKLAGILCESQIHSVDRAHLFLGMGINLGFAPELGPDTYQSISIEQISGKNLYVEKWIREFAAVFNREWPDFSTLQWFDVYRKHLFQPGHIFFSGNRKLWIDSYGVDGGIVMQDSLFKKHAIQSANEPLKWDFIMDQTKKLLLDIGNSRTKYAVFSTAGDILKSGVFSIDQDTEAFQEIYYVSVNRNAEQKFTQTAKNIGISSFPIEKRKVNLTHSVYSFAELGIDRLCFIEFVLAKVFGTTPLLLVSAGTALTLDVIDREKNHLGGFIVPGFKLAATALHELTSQLPEVSENISMDEFLLGIGTTTAIQSGLFNLGLALIEKICTQYKIKTIVLTGGDSKLYKKVLEKSFEVICDPNAVLKGAFELLRG